MAEVITMPGVVRTECLVEPNETVVGRLEELLDRAKRGEIQAIGYALVLIDGSTEPDWAKGDATENDMAAAVADLFNAVMQCRRMFAMESGERIV